MQLSNLNISLATYGPHEGKYKGEVHFKNQYGSVEIVLDEGVSRKVLELCAEALVEQSKKTAALIAGNIFESVPVLENKE